MFKPTRVLASLLAGLMTMPLVHEANAAALYFEKTVVKTGSESTCLRFAQDVARNQGFLNTHRNAAEVAGEKDGAYVSVTCVGRGGDQQAIAVVMSTSDSFDVARRVAQQVAAQIRGIVCFDTPC